MPLYWLKATTFTLDCWKYNIAYSTRLFTSMTGIILILYKEALSILTLTVLRCNYFRESICLTQPTPVSHTWNKTETTFFISFPYKISFSLLIFVWQMYFLKWRKFFVIVMISFLLLVPLSCPFIQHRTVKITWFINPKQSIP